MFDQQQQAAKFKTQIQKLTTNEQPLKYEQIIAQYKEQSEALMSEYKSLQQEFQHIKRDSENYTSEFQTFTKQNTDKKHSIELSLSEIDTETHNIVESKEALVNKIINKTAHIAKTNSELEIKCTAQRDQIKRMSENYDLKELQMAIKEEEARRYGIKQILTPVLY